MFLEVCVVGLQGEQYSSVRRLHADEQSQSNKSLSLTNCDPGHQAWVHSHLVDDHLSAGGADGI